MQRILGTKGDDICIKEITTLKKRKQILVDRKRKERLIDFLKTAKKKNRLEKGGDRKAARATGIERRTTVIGLGRAQKSFRSRPKTQNSADTEWLMLIKRTYSW